MPMAVKPDNTLYQQTERYIMPALYEFLFAGILTMFSLTTAASAVCKIDKQAGFTGISRGKDLITTSSATKNYVISSFQLNRKTYLDFAGFSCYEKGVKEPCSEANTPAGKCTELRSEARDGKIIWKLKYQWRNLAVVRTIEAGKFPGFKLTYDIEVTRDFQADRIYLSFRLPKENRYIRTGYLKNGVIQFRPVKKPEWFGIQRSKDFPYIFFSGDTVKEGVMIMAGDLTSWNRLPNTLLYSSTAKCYWTVEFMYRFGRILKKGARHSVSVYIIPIDADNPAADAEGNFRKLRNVIR